MEANLYCINNVKRGTDHFIFVMDGSSYKQMYEYMLLDLKDNSNVSFVTDERCMSNKKRILLSKKIQKVTNGHLDWIGYEKNELYSILKNRCELYERVVVIFFNASLNYNAYLSGTLKEYKKKWNNIKYVLFYLDIVGVGVSINADYLRKKNVFDLIYTVDKSDAKKYSMIHKNTIYSKNETMCSKTIQNDIYFCGVTKNRGPLIKKCAVAANDNGVECLMDIVCDDDNLNLAEVKGINVCNNNQYLSYEEVLSRELMSKVFLDIVQQGQVALTLRAYEAVVYNRKLLSNNKSLFELEFYNSKYMRYFESVEDIDWEWVKEDVEVNYNYRDEFSPKIFLDDIVGRLNDE